MDYAICLEASPNRAYVQSDVSHHATGIYQSRFFEPVRFRPVVVSIEAKVAGNEIEAMTQLSVRMMAYFERLQKNYSMLWRTLGNANAFPHQHTRTWMVCYAGNAEGRQKGISKISKFSHFT